MRAFLLIRFHGTAVRAVTLTAAAALFAQSAFTSADLLDPSMHEQSRRSGGSHHIL